MRFCLCCRAAEEAEAELAGAVSRAREAETALKQATVDSADAQVTSWPF